MHSRPLEILYEDNHLLAVNKPTGTATMGVAPDEPSAWAAAKAYIKQQYDKRGNVYLGVVSRLDRAASGVLLFARTSKAAARLSEQFRAREVRKLYWAVVEGRLAGEGELSDFVAKDEAMHRMRIAREGEPSAQLARLTYHALAVGPGTMALGSGGDRPPTGGTSSGTFLEIELETGRKHQVRLQLASRGHPIVGDVKYGGHGSLADAPHRPAIALHARRLELVHPVRKELLAIVAEPPAFWRRLGLPESAE